MLISCNWLRRHVDLDGVDLDDLGRRFTLAVAELEEVIHVGQNLDKIVVGHVLEVHPIEGAKVRRTLVDVGQTEPLQIVCGAPNVTAGQTVVVALVGAQVGDLTIGNAEIRGVPSSGMICSESELGISESHDGIMVLGEGQAKIGVPFGEQFPVADTLFEIDNKSLTHRPDLWGHRGIAREVAALLGRPLLAMPLDVTYGDAAPLKISVEDFARCPRYSAVTLDGVHVAPSPLWLRLLLSRVGTRPISNIVDATNFVMLDLGNPLHAFDRRQIAGDTIVVRRAAAGEAFTTLDGTERKLTSEDLLIADTERGVALAGIMGGENSEIRDDTTSIVLEAAAFDASGVRMSGQRLGLRTESSARFEKSLDPLLPEAASRAFCRLLQELVPATTITSAFMDFAAPYPEPVTIVMRPELVRRKLGIPDLTDARISEILTGLDFTLSPGTPDAQGLDSINVGVPSFRATKDIALEIDLVEEVGRVYGYDNIVPVSPQVGLAQPHANKRKNFERAVRAFMTQACGADELMTYAFDYDPHLATIDGIDPKRLTLANPISQDMPALKRHLAPNLLLALERNDRRVASMNVFEIDRVFLDQATNNDSNDSGAVPHQPKLLGGLIALEESDPSEATAFRRLKGQLVGLAATVKKPVIGMKQGGVKHPWCHPVRQARLLVTSADGNDTLEIGYIAQLHPLTAHKLGLRKAEVALFELDLDAWRDNSKDAAVGYRPLPKFPSVFRDFAVLVDESIRAADVHEAIAGHPLVTDVSFQSVYRGQGVDPGKKSMAWSVAAGHPDHTLVEADIQELVSSVWAALADKVGGVPRA